MGSIVTPADSPMRQYLDVAGADASLALYDRGTTTLTAPDVSDAALASAKSAVDARTSPATTADKRSKEQQIREAARDRHEDTFLLADATYQAQLSAITAASTLADLDAIVP
jgi:hypothetical protein